MKTPSVPGFYETRCYTLTKKNFHLQSVSIHETAKEAVEKGKEFLKAHPKAFFYKIYFEDHEMGCEMTKNKTLLDNY